MPITIYELLPSDTLSQAVDKINFNFDQIILNGGGPPGASGLRGLIGPSGGRGLRGSIWYNDETSYPGTNPNSIIIPDIIIDDLYLQANGNVWKYSGTSWIDSGVNLKGEQGPSGISIGFGYAGGFPGSSIITANQNVAYVLPMPDGSGADQLTNQAISTVLIGGVPSNATPPAGSGIVFTDDFKIPDIMTAQLDSSVVSMLVHQKDSLSSAIRFMGGGNSGDNYEQSTLSNLVNITIGADDTFNINVPKQSTSPASITDLTGLNLNTTSRGQQFYSGKHIIFISGGDSTPSGYSGEISDVSFIINTSNPAIPGKFSVATTNAASTAVIEVGGNITTPNSTSKTGKVLLEGGTIDLTGGKIRLRTSVDHIISIDSSNINIKGSTGPVVLTTISSQNINITSDGSITSTAAVDISSTATNQIIKNAPTIFIGAATNTHYINVDNTSSSTGGVKLQGNFTWGGPSLVNTYSSSHRNISINKQGLVITNPAIYIGNPSGLGGLDLMINLFKGASAITATEYLKVYTASTEVKSASSNAGFVGHTVENSSAVMSADNIGVKISGIDRSGGNTLVSTKFHAKEDTTSVYNRMHYVPRYLNIDPIVENITSEIGYTIPASVMDATYLDIFIGNEGIVYDTPDEVSDTTWTLYIPEGTYSGQRLVVHIQAVGGQYWDGTVIRNWPKLGGNVIVAMKGGAQGSSYADVQIGNLVIGDGSTTPRVGAEATFELLWVGKTYDAYDTTGPGSSSSRSRTSGWILTNGIAITNATVGEYTAVESNLQWMA